MVVRSIDSNCDDGGGMEIQMAGRAGEKSSLSGISISILPFRTTRLRRNVGRNGHNFCKNGVTRIFFLMQKGPSNVFLVQS